MSKKKRPKLKIKGRDSKAKMLALEKSYLAPPKGKRLKRTVSWQEREINEMIREGMRPQKEYHDEAGVKAIIKEDLKKKRRKRR